MDNFLGLPIHPLLVHAPVMAVPALIIAAVCYVAIPTLRQRIGWLVMILSVIAPLSTLGAWWSGHRFYDLHVDMISQAGHDPAMFQNLLAEHLKYGDILVWLVPLLAVTIWAFGYLTRRPRLSGATPSAPHRIGVIVLAVAVIGLSGTSGWYTFKSGHSGAEVVWSEEGER